MAWVNLTVDDVLAHISECELEQIEQGGDQSPSIKRIDALIKQIVVNVRSKVFSCHLNTQEGEAGTIPEECVFAASVCVRQSLLASLPALDGLNSEARKEEYREAKEFLNDVASCKIKLNLTSQSVIDDLTGGDDLINFCDEFSKKLGKGRNGKDFGNFKPFR